jgi:hypothetical protein
MLLRQVSSLRYCESLVTALPYLRLHSDQSGVPVITGGQSSADHG